MTFEQRLESIDNTLKAILNHLTADKKPVETIVEPVKTVVHKVEAKAKPKDVKPENKIALPQEIQNQISKEAVLEKAREYAGKRSIADAKAVLMKHGADKTASVHTIPADNLNACYEELTQLLSEIA